MPRIGHVLLTIWAGALWTICGLVAPTAFSVLDRQSAGSLVGKLFASSAWLGATVAIVLLILIRRRPNQRSTRALIVITGLAPVVSEIALGPLMHSARLAGDLRTFGLLHGLAGVVFLVACLCALALVWKVNRAE